MRRGIRIIFLCLIISCVLIRMDYASCASISGVNEGSMDGTLGTGYLTVNEASEPLTGYKWWGGLVIPLLMGALLLGVVKMLRHRKKGNP